MRDSSTERVWLNGWILPARRALIPALDQAVQYGFGLFEVARAYGGVPFRLDRHLARLRRSARHFGLRVPFRDSIIDRAARELTRRNGRPEAYVRVVLTAGPEGGRPSVLVRTRPLPPLPAAWYRRGASVRLAPWRRDPRAPTCGHKTLNYLDNVLTHDRARDDGLADTILVDPQGALLEGSVSNVFLVRRVEIHTPRLGTILPGVTREAVIECARAAGIRVRERSIDVSELRRADEVFLTNALFEIVPVVRTGNQRVGRGRVGTITRTLMAAFRALVARESRD